MMSPGDYRAKKDMPPRRIVCSDEATYIPDLFPTGRPVYTDMLAYRKNFSVSEHGEIFRLDLLQSQKVSGIIVKIPTQRLDLSAGEECIMI